MKEAVSAGTFDPPTEAHLDFFERASRMADKLVVGIAVNADKKPLFSLIEREVLLGQELRHLDNVEIVPIEGLLVDFALRRGIRYIIRGLRNEKEGGEELTLALANHKERPGIETILLPSRQHLTDVSSRIIKARREEQGNVSGEVRMSVNHALDARMAGQYFMGVVGGSGTGKSTLSEEVCNYLGEQGIEATHINLDDIGHEILSAELQDHIYVDTRKKIIETFGVEVENQDGSIDRRQLGKIVFDSPDELEKLNKIMREPMLLRLREHIYKKPGFFLLDAAILAEANLTYLVNNHVVLAHADDETVNKRLSARDSLTSEQIERRVNSQFSSQRKKEVLEKKIEEDRYGEVVEVNTSHSSANELAKEYAPKILEIVDIYGELRIKSILKHLGDPNPGKSYEEIRLAYSMDKTPYHSLFHIVDGLDLLWEYRGIIPNFEKVALAWLYHDMIYNPGMKGKNEEKSALCAQKKCESLGLGEGFSNDVHRFIITTKHIHPPSCEEEMYMADIDLAILGVLPEKYDEYERRIRREYSSMPPEKFKKGRLAFLRGLLERDNIFHTPVFRGRFEAQAQENIRRRVGEFESRKLEFERGK